VIKLKKISETVIFIIIGIILGIMLAVFDVPMTLENYVYLFIIVFIIAYIFYLGQIISVNNKIKKYLSNSKYKINKLEARLYKMKNMNIRIYLLINLSTGYSIKKDYKSALRVLYNIDINKSADRVKVVYYNNLAYFLYKTGDISKASEVLKKNKKLFNKYLTNLQLAPLLIDTMEQIKKAEQVNSIKNE
jgi:hypothetical protein